MAGTEGYDLAFHHRRSVRLRNYDYGQQGAYFLTICTHERACLLGEVVSGQVILGEAGRLVEEAWLQTPTLRPNIFLDACVVMPNHLHAIAVILTPASENRALADAQASSAAQSAARTSREVGRNRGDRGHRAGGVYQDGGGDRAGGVYQYAPTEARGRASRKNAGRPTPTPSPDQPLQPAAPPRRGVSIYAPVSPISVGVPVPPYAPASPPSPAPRSPAKSRPRLSPSHTIGALVRGFKAATTARVNTLRNSPGVPFWQRNYYEHIIRDDADLERIRAYVAANPARWTEDSLHP
ncbi:MAG: transposase [Chloroflexota bacterium]